MRNSSPNLTNRGASVRESEGGPMRRGRQMRLTLLNAILAAMTWTASVKELAGADASPLPHVAIIAGEGERTPATALFSQLETVLATNRSFALVERDQIRRVLAEHELAVAASIRSDKTIELGRLLAADILV